MKTGTAIFPVVDEFKGEPEGLVQVLSPDRRISVYRERGIVAFMFTNGDLKTPVVMSEEAAVALRNLLARLLPGEMANFAVDANSYWLESTR